MNKNEAREWILGKRSMCNLITPEPIETIEVRIAQADAAKTQQAYYMLLAYRDGLVEEA